MICFTGCVAACVSPERATDYRQVVECSARNPCKHGKRISNPDGVTEFCRAFGTFKIFAFIAGVSLRFTACLCSVVLFRTCQALHGYKMCPAFFFTALEWLHNQFYRITMFFSQWRKCRWTLSVFCFAMQENAAR